LEKDLRASPDGEQDSETKRNYFAGSVMHEGLPKKNKPVVITQA